MRTPQTLLTGMWLGSVAAAATAGDDARRRGAADPWHVAPVAATDVVAGLPMFFDEVGGPASGPSAEASADDDADVGAGGAAGVGGETPFDKGTWSLQLTGSYYTTVAGSDVTLAYGTASLGYYYADTWAVDLSVSGYALEEDGEPDGVAASLGLNLRKHFVVRDPWSVYIDGGVGMIRADGEFPEGGTNTNFTLQGGLGITYRLHESLHLVGGARWFHISNARRHGEDENASTDGVAVYGGLMWTW